MVGGLSWGYVGLSWGQCGPMLGLCWPMLGLCWPILRPMLAHVDPSWATKAEKVEKRGSAQNTVKRGGFWPYWLYCGWGGGPSLLRRVETCRTAMPRPGGPWPDLSAYARQLARGPTMLAHLVAICWHPCGAKRSEKWEQQSNASKTQDVLMVGGLSWGYVGPSWGYVGVSGGQRGPILGLCWLILGLCWPILGLCWPILGAMLAHVGAMLAHLEAYVGPCWPILSHKLRKMGKMGKAQNTKHRKTRAVSGWYASPVHMRR